MRRTTGATARPRPGGAVARRRCGRSTRCSRRWRGGAAGGASPAARCAAFGDRLDPRGARRVDDAAPRAAALLTLAARAWAAGEAVDAAQALPLYLRDKVALTIAEREAVRAAGGRRMTSAARRPASTADRRRRRVAPPPARRRGAAPALRLEPMHVAHLDAVLAIERRAYDFPWSRGNFIDSLAAGYPARRLLDADGAAARLLRRHARRRRDAPAQPHRRARPAAARPCARACSTR